MVLEYNPLKPFQQQNGFGYKSGGWRKKNSGGRKNLGSAREILKEEESNFHCLCTLHNQKTYAS
jgi:hypothetical protein